MQLRKAETANFYHDALNDEVKTMNTHSLGKYLLIFCFAAVAGLIGYSVLNAPDRRSAGDKVGDAINELPNGIDKAARQLENRTPGDKLKDAAEDVGDDLKKTTNQQ